MWEEQILKISVIDSATQRRLVVEGKLVAPWAAELRNACQEARADLDGRELVVEVKHITTINQEGTATKECASGLRNGAVAFLEKLFDSSVLLDRARACLHMAQDDD